MMVLFIFLQILLDQKIMLRELMTFIFILKIKNVNGNFRKNSENPQKEENCLTID